MTRRRYSSSKPSLPLTIPRSLCWACIRAVGETEITDAERRQPHRILEYRFRSCAAHTTSIPPLIAPQRNAGCPVSSRPYLALKVRSWQRWRAIATSHSSHISLWPYGASAIVRRIRSTMNASAWLFSSQKSSNCAPPYYDGRILLINPLDGNATARPRPLAPPLSPAGCDRRSGGGESAL